MTSWVLGYKMTLSTSMSKTWYLAAKWTAKIPNLFLKSLFHIDQGDSRHTHPTRTCLKNPRLSWDKRPCVVEWACVCQDLGVVVYILVLSLCNPPLSVSSLSSSFFDGAFAVKMSLLSVSKQMFVSNENYTFVCVQCDNARIVSVNMFSKVVKYLNKRYSIYTKTVLKYVIKWLRKIL